MELSMLHYYFLISLEKEIPFPIKNKFIIDKSFSYSSSNFIDLGYYYKALHIFKTDKYKIAEKLHDEAYFFPYIFDNMILAKYKNDYRHLYFIYGNIAAYSLDKFVVPYIKSLVTKKRSYYKLTNMIDYYYAYKNDKIDLSKVNLSKLFKYDELYSEEINSFVKKPIQKNLKFFACKNYFLKSAKVKNFIDSNYTKFSLLYFTSFFLDLFKINKRKKKKASSFRYSKKIDTTILNLNHQTIIIEGIETTESFDDIIDKAYSYAKALIKAINNYIFFGNTKDFNTITGLNITVDLKEVENKEDEQNKQE